MKLKSKGTPLTLSRGPEELGVTPPKAAGVRISARSDILSRWAEALYDIELVVDGSIVDLNRILLPADTPIIDKRFTD